MLDAWLRRPANQALLVLVPRHPQRFGEVAALLEQRGVRWQRRSIALPDAGTQVWLGDSMGEMAAYYAMADVAFIGGSLAPRITSYNVCYTKLLRPLAEILE